MRTPADAALSAILGTSCMSMKGDLPGLSKCWSGTIGSYQYSGRDGAAASGADAIAGAIVAESAGLARRDIR